MVVPRLFLSFLIMAAATSAAAQQVSETEPNDASASATLISLGQDVHGDINREGDIDYFVFDVPAGTQLEFYLTFVPDWTPTQWLIDRDGQTAIERRDWSTHGEKLIRQVISTAGRYFARVSSYTGGSGFSYTVRLQRYARPRTGLGDPVARFYAPTSISRFDDLVAGSAGDVLLSWSGGAVRVRNGSTQTATDVHNRQGWGEALAIDGYGNLLIGACETEPDIPCHNTVVWKVSASGERSKFYSVPGVLSAIIVGPDGDVWMAARGDAARASATPTLYRLAPDGVLRESIPLEVLRMKFSPKGELHYTNAYDGISKLVNNQPQKVITPAREEWFGDFAFDQDGWIYVVTAKNNPHENWGGVSRMLLYDAQYRLQGDPLAEVDDDFAQFSVGPVAFLRDADGAMTNRLVTIHNGYRLGIPSPEFTEIVELNHAGMGAPGARVGVDLSSVTLATSQQGHIGSTYSNTLRMTDAPQGIRWTVETGSLPPGITLNESNGELNGVPTQTGSFTFSVRPQSGSKVGFGRFSITIDATPAIQTSVADITNALLGGPALSADAVRFLDSRGNNNGKLDVGDLRAYLKAQGQLSGSAQP